MNSFQFPFKKTCEIYASYWADGNPGNGCMLKQLHKVKKLMVNESKKLLKKKNGNAGNKCKKIFHMNKVCFPDRLIFNNAAYGNADLQYFNKLYRIFNYFIFELGSFHILCRIHQLISEPPYPANACIFAILI